VSPVSTTSIKAVYNPFTLIALPDSQYYALDYPQLITTMIQWIVDNKEVENIAFVLHEGDLTHQNTESEWTNEDTSISLLDGVVPYAICPGNHDTPTTKFNLHFPVSRFQGYSWFGGVYEDNKIDNAYYSFRAGGTDWLIIALEYNPRDSALEWANTIAEANPVRCDRAF